MGGGEGQSECNENMDANEENGEPERENAEKKKGGRTPSPSPRWNDKLSRRRRVYCLTVHYVFLGVSVCLLVCWDRSTKPDKLTNITPIVIPLSSRSWYRYPKFRPKPPTPHM